MNMYHPRTVADIFDDFENAGYDPKYGAGHSTAFTRAMGHLFDAQQREKDVMCDIRVNDKIRDDYHDCCCNAASDMYFATGGKRNPTWTLLQELSGKSGHHY